MSTYAFSIGQVVNGNTIIALPTGSGNYGGMYELQRPDNTTFYDNLSATQLQAEFMNIGFDGDEVNASNPLPVAVISGGGGSGSIGTTGTPNVSTIKDATTSNQVAVDSSGRLAILTDGTAATAKTQASGFAQDTSGVGMLGFISSMVANLRAIATSVAGTLGISGTVSVSNLPSTQAISAASLPLPSGAATAAKQPALGTAGSAAADVISIQGVASMTAVKTDGSAVTQPISAASLPLPTGAATAAKQPALGTAGTASADVITIQGKTGMTPVVTSSGALARTDYSTTIASGGAAQDVFTAGQATHGFYFQNLSTVGMYIRDDGSPASAGAGSIYVPPNGYYESGPGIGAPTTKLSVFCATTSSAFTCKTV